jgi:predicted SpoU family rRNA methylase
MPFVHRLGHRRQGDAEAPSLVTLVGRFHGANPSLSHTGERTGGGGWLSNLKYFDITAFK